MTLRKHLRESIKYLCSVLTGLVDLQTGDTSSYHQDTIMDPALALVGKGRKQTLCRRVPHGCENRSRAVPALGLSISMHLVSRQHGVAADPFRKLLDQLESLFYEILSPLSPAGRLLPLRMVKLLQEAAEFAGFAATHPTHSCPAATT